MGTKMAPSYANIYMGDIEEQFNQPLSWFRFIDDVDMKWINSDTKVDKFFEHANSIHPSMRITNFDVTIPRSLKLTRWYFFRNTKMS
jgi:hypothetical protein